MNITEIKIGDILLNEINDRGVLATEVLIVTEVSYNCSRYGAPYVATKVIKSPVYGKGKEKVFTGVDLDQGLSKIA